MAEKESLLKKEMSIDFSDTDLQMKLRLEASLPEQENKMKLWKKYVNHEFNQK